MRIAVVEPRRSQSPKQQIHHIPLAWLLAPLPDLHPKPGKVDLVNLTTFGGTRSAQQAKQSSWHGQSRGCLSVPATPPCGHHVCFLPESWTGERDYSATTVRVAAVLRFALIFGLWVFNFYMPGGRARTVEQDRSVHLSIPAPFPFPALC
jgi:hypothetical protein